MTEQEWLTIMDPARMLTEPLDVPGNQNLASPLQGRISPRKLRLFACACCRQVWGEVECPSVRVDGPHDTTCQCRGTGRIGGLTDPRSRNAVEVTERYADLLSHKWNPNWLVADEELYSANATGLLSQAITAAWDVVTPEPAGFYEHMAAAVTHPGRFHHVLRSFAKTETGKAEAPTQATLLRCIAGNLFQPVTLCGEPHTHGGNLAAYVGDAARKVAIQGCKKCKVIRTHNDGAVVKIAQSVYDSRRWDELPILRDALIDAGCQDEAILAHCLESLHARGCHVVDLILGKE